MIRIRLLGQHAGYLDVIEDSVFALNLAVADIKDVTKRTGSFSKTIMLPGTKNNNKLLNDYFEVNVIDGTFSINKVQRCLLLEDNVPIFNNMILQLISVKKEQATNMEDDLVEYEVSIKDTSGDFFTNINNRYLDELDFSEFGHTYSAQEIYDSFSHSYVDGYKYLIPFGDDNYYPIVELAPAIYVKNYWTKIHADAGFTYQWTSETNQNVKFDKLLIPYNGGAVKLSEEEINKNRVIATGSDQSIITTSFTTPVGGYYPYRGGLQRIFATTEIQDPLNAYNPANSRYTSPFFIMPPSNLEWIVEFDYDLVINNLQALSGNILGSQRQYYGQFNIICRIRNVRTGIYDTGIINQSPTPTIQNTTFPPGPNIYLSGRASRIVNSSGHQPGDLLEIYLGVEHAAGQSVALNFQRITEVNVEVKNLKIQIQTSSPVFGSYINPTSFIPKQIKQSEFVKSVMTMFNLFVEPDKINPTQLNYYTRDEYYDNGGLIDWTKKMSRDTEQSLNFLPELGNKSIIFSYKQDDDEANKVYFETTKEVYGQHQVIFSNNYVKGVETKEIIFSPTPMAESGWNSVLPMLPSGEQKSNIRILIDAGRRNCQPWYLVNYVDPSVTNFPPGATAGDWLSLTDYPLISHLDNDYNATLDINFGVCDFYFYDLKNICQNNLFNNFWRRTMAQKNNGKLLTAYFWLKGSDVANLRLNAKIRIDNSYWNINRIIDFDANAYKLTKVELMSIDDELLLPAYGKDSEFLTPGQQLAPFFEWTPVGDNQIIIKNVKSSYNSVNHNSRLTSNNNNGVINLGSFNKVDGGVKAVIVGDFIQATQSGLYIGQNTFIGDNLGNVGGLPSTLAVDNTTGGSSIVVSLGDDIRSEILSFLNLFSDQGVSIQVFDGVSRVNQFLADQSSGYTGMYANETALNFNTKVEIDYQTIVAQYFDSTYTSFMSISPNQLALEHTDNSTYINSIVLQNVDRIDITSQDAVNNKIALSSIQPNGNSVQRMTDGTTYNNTIEIHDDTTTGIRITVDDLAGNSSAINLKGTGIEVSTAIFNFSPSLPAYADDAAAGVGGLVTGDLYQTDGTGALTTAGIVMIKQ